MARGVLRKQETQLLIEQVSKKRKNHPSAFTGQNATLTRLFTNSPRKGDATKASIVEAAIDCMTTEGIDGLTYDAIAKRIKAQRSLVNYHFKSVDEIVWVTVQFIVGNGQEFILSEMIKDTKSSSPIEKYIAANFKWASEWPKHASILVLLFYLSSYNKRFRELNAKIRKAGKDRTLSLLIGQDVFAPLKGVNTEAIANILHDAISMAIIDAVALSKCNSSRMRQILEDKKRAIMEVLIVAQRKQV